MSSTRNADLVAMFISRAKFDNRTVDGLCHAYGVQIANEKSRIKNFRSDSPEYYEEYNCAFDLKFEQLSMQIDALMVDETSNNVDRHCTVRGFFNGERQWKVSEELANRRYLVTNIYDGSMLITDIADMTNLY
jgi:hypothetical protein